MNIAREREEPIHKLANWSQGIPTSEGWTDENEQQSEARARKGTHTVLSGSGQEYIFQGRNHQLLIIYWKSHMK